MSKEIFYYGEFTMYNTLSDLFYGKVIPGERYCVNPGEARQKLEELELCRSKLRGELSDRGKDVLNQYESLVGEMNVLACEDYFIGGYRLGARMTIEALWDE
jgi:hypothetical protein